WIEACLASATARVFHRAARAVDPGVLLIPVDGPFPDIPRHVMESVAIGRERRDRCRPFEAVLTFVLPGELALPGVGHVLAVGGHLIAPAIFSALQSATRRK